MNPDSTNDASTSAVTATRTPLTPSRVRAAVMVGPGAFTVEQRATPACPPGSVLVRPDRVGLCGTDLTIAAGRHGRARTPLVIGHEFTAVVIESGDLGVAEGSRVVVQPTLSCGQCWPCRHSSAHTCRHLGLIGIDTDGALVEVLAVPAASVLVLPSAVGASEAVLAEPLAVAVHAVNQADLAPAATVLIIGAGPIGVLTGLVAASRGARVLISEPHDDRRTFAETLGFEALDPTKSMPEQVDSLTDTSLCDVLFDCAAYPPLALDFSAAVHEHGTIVLVALYSQPAALDLHAIAFAEQRVIGSRVYTRRDFEQAVDLIATDALRLHRLPVSVFPLADIEEAIVAARNGDALKVTVDPQT